MTHYGLICPNTTGHLNTMLPLGVELKKRGHLVTYIGLSEAESAVIKSGLEFQLIGQQEFPPGANTEYFNYLGQLKGLAVTRYIIQHLRKTVMVNLREFPDIIQKEGIEALLVDQVTPEGGAIADSVGIPFITICSAVVLHQDVTIPPPFTNWQYNKSWWALLRNYLGHELLKKIAQPITILINEYRQKSKLPRQYTPKDRYSTLAQISQQPFELEFPRNDLPAWFHFTGPYHSQVGREVTDFPYDKLTGKPIIYASMGTILNGLIEVFQIIAEACTEFDAQLVISLGGSATPDSLPSLAGNPLVVQYAPQLELLKKASLTITHAGLNTTLECLSNGVPMVAIPVANDQPGVASRIVWSGCGESIPVKKLTVEKLRKAVEKVLTEDSYKQNAVRLQKAIQQSGGVIQAADIIEQAIATGKPVINHNRKKLS